MLTAYDFAFARIFDEAGIDVLLVGDSLGNVVQGLDDDAARDARRDRLPHAPRRARGAARARGRRHALRLLPGRRRRTRCAARSGCVKEGGAHAVKLEGGATRRGDDRARSSPREIPVMGHVGLTPQSVHRDGRLPRAGPRRGGRASACSPTRARSRRRAPSPWCSRACPPDLAARDHRATLAIPTIGIGAGVDCDGQVLVMHDLLGPQRLGAELRQAVRGARRARRRRRRAPSPTRSRTGSSPATSTPTARGRPCGSSDERRASCSALADARARRGAAHRARADDGRAPRRPPRARRRGAAARRPRRGLDLREPDAVRRRARTSPPTRARSSATSRAAARPASTWSSRPTAAELYPPGAQTCVEVDGARAAALRRARGRATSAASRRS